MEMNLHSLKSQARLAGLLYLLVTITGVYVIMYVPSQIFVPGDSVSTIKNIISNEFLFRTGVLVDLITNTFFLLLAVALYRLLKSVNENLAKTMLALVIVQVPVVFFMEALNITSLMILKGEIFTTFALGQSQDLAILLIKINEYGTLPLEMFWGLWLLPFGLLVYKSEFIPRIFGILILIAGIAYMVSSTVGILFPDQISLVRYPTLLFAGVGEISITLWLLIKGVKTKELKA